MTVRSLTRLQFILVASSRPTTSEGSSRSSHVLLWTMRPLRRGSYLDSTNVSGTLASPTPWTSYDVVECLTMFADLPLTQWPHAWSAANIPELADDLNTKESTSPATSMTWSRQTSSTSRTRSTSSLWTKPLATRLPQNALGASSRTFSLPWWPPGSGSLDLCESWWPIRNPLWWQ